MGKLIALTFGFVKRIVILFSINQFDVVFIHREAAPIGPPVFEWIIAKIFRKKTIYDFDDAIWMTDRKNELLWMQMIKWRSKVKGVCKWAYKVSCGNKYLYNYAKKFNSNSFINPTTIDTINVHNPELYAQSILSKKSDQVIIGWTGSHSTLKYLNEIELILQNLENKFSQLEFWIIADKAPQLKLRNLRFKPWSKETEIPDLAQFDIGIMPLPDDEWAKGKCGFKILQYMAFQIPSVASPVGVNGEIIHNGTNGFLCSTLEDWENRLIELIENRPLRHAIGREARKTVVENYSIVSNATNFMNLIKD
jgi:glycosyltransferase involved in cell wall biosynthesis